MDESIIRSFYGTTDAVDEFVKTLQKGKVLDGGWSTEYRDSESDICWLKYSIDDGGFIRHLMRCELCFQTEKIINISLNSSFVDEIFAAASRLLLEEQLSDLEFRTKLPEALTTAMDSNPSEFELQRIRTIIIATSLTDPLNRRNIIGKSIDIIRKDAEVFQNVANEAQSMLEKISRSFRH